jgi:hypothetical protein
VHDEGLHTGYARVSVNQTALDWQFVYSGSRAVPGSNASDSGDAGKVFDHFTLTKDLLPKHAPPAPASAGAEKAQAQAQAQAQAERRLRAFL